MLSEPILRADSVIYEMASAKSHSRSDKLE